MQTLIKPKGKINLKGKLKWNKKTRLMELYAMWKPVNITLKTTDVLREKSALAVAVRVIAPTPAAIPLKQKCNFKVPDCLAVG